MGSKRGEVQTGVDLDQTRGRLGWNIDVDPGEDFEFNKSIVYFKKVLKYN